MEKSTRIYSGYCVVWYFTETSQIIYCHHLPKFYVFSGVKNKKERVKGIKFIFSLLFICETLRQMTRDET